MTILDGVTRRAEHALEELQRRAGQEGWDTDRIEREKDLYMLNHEVSLCQDPGCMVMVQSIPGFLWITCEEHRDVGG